MEIEKQRCFTIKPHKLNLLLTALDVNFTTDIFKPTADYIFQKAVDYDVVISYRGSYPYLENKMEEFIKEMTDN